MNSPLPKVLHKVCGRPLIENVMDAVRAVGVKRIIVVVGHQAELVQNALSSHTDVEFVLQEEQKGTGHAVMMCQECLAKHVGPILVLAGDTPLLRTDSLDALLIEKRTVGAACVIGTAVTDANEGLGRIVRDSDGEFLRIVEQRDATAKDAAIQEINTGCFVFDCQALFDALNKVQTNNFQGEYYLTDCASILQSMGMKVSALPKFEIEEAMGVNTQQQLEDVENVIQRRLPNC